MRRCPTCDRTYEGNLKFCQSDGTPLVEDAAGAGGGGDDPLKTRVGIPLQTEPDAGGAGDFDPMKTMLAAPPPVDKPPPSPFGDASGSGSGGSSNAPPQSGGLNAPSFGDLSSPQFGAASNSSPLPSEPAAPGNFGQSPSGGFGQSPSGGFGDAARTPTFQEPEPNFGNQNFGQQPFGQSPAEWAPPPAPSQNWGDQGLNQNTPFAPPVATGGQTQVLPIVSLIAGIISVLCCYFSIVTGPVALITGYLGLNQIKQNPAQYGGRGLALAGMITGGLGLVILILYFLLILLGAITGGLR